MKPSSSIAPLDSRASIGQKAASRIREAILKGNLRPGERLSDAQIAKDLGTSRGPIREALRLLEAEGLVEHRADYGTFVVDVSPEDMRERHELRVALECHAARLLAERRTDKSLSVLRDICETMKRAADAGDHLTISKADKDFHEQLCRLTGDRHLYEVLEREILNMFIFGFDRQYGPDWDMGREFPSLIEAIETGDGELAARLMEEHLNRANDLLPIQVRVAGARRPFGEHGQSAKPTMNPMGVGKGDGPEIIDSPANCVGCHSCELACSFHHFGTFQPSRASVIIEWDPDNGVVTRKRYLENVNDRLACDECRSEPERLCDLYCNRQAVRDALQRRANAQPTQEIQKR